MNILSWKTEIDFLKIQIKKKIKNFEKKLKKSSLSY